MQPPWVVPPDADHTGDRRRRRDAGLRAEVADRGDDDGSAAGRVVDRLGDARHLLAAAEVEAHVDHVGVVVGGEHDPGRDVVGAAAAEAIEHPHRHQLRPVGEPGEADPVVGLLGDRPGDVGAVAVAIERQAAVVDEVMAFDELARGEVGAAAEAAAERAVGDAGVEDRDRDAAPAGALDRFQVFPGADRVDPAGRGGEERGARRLPRGGSSTVCETHPPGTPGSPVSVPGSLGTAPASVADAVATKFGAA